jgi:hypothetical protein
MSFLVREITLQDEIEDFLSLPSEIYKDNPNWIAPQYSELRRALNPLRNPYFLNASLKIYVCYSSGEPVCRAITVINHHHWTRWNKKSAFFGFFESVDNINAVRFLFEKIESDCRSAGAEFLEGPFNPNHYSELGILTDNFNCHPAFFETYNPPYYPTLLKGEGFDEYCQFHTRKNNDIFSTITKKYKSLNDEVTSKYITIRKFNIFRFKRDLGILREINNDAFENNSFFLPLSIEEYKFSAKYLFLVTSPGLIMIAEHNGIPIGAAQFVIDINNLIRTYNGGIKAWQIPGFLWKRRKIKELIIFTAGVKKAFRKTRVFSVMLKSAVKIFKDYSTISTTWISDENLGANLDDLLEMKPDKHFSIFSKHLQN